MSEKFGFSGGTGGAAYNAPAPPAQDQGPWKISELKGRSGDRINQVELIWENHKHATREGGPFGGGGGGPFEFKIASDDYLTQIRGSVNNFDGSVRIFSLQFATRDGGVSPVFGKETAFTFFFDCPKGYQITGLFGRSGTEVDGLGVYIDLIPG